jgi:hypothetical protein
VSAPVASFASRRAVIIRRHHTHRRHRQQHQGRAVGRAMAIIMIIVVVGISIHIAATVLFFLFRSLLLLLVLRIRVVLRFLFLRASLRSFFLSFLHPSDLVRETCHGLLNFPTERLQTRIDRLALKGEDTEDAFVDAA